MKLLKLLIMSLLIISCGLPTGHQIKHRKPDHTNDKGFDDIKRTFLNEANKRDINLNWQDVDLPISFNKLEDAYGMCYWDKIEIDPSLKMSPTLLEAVVLHELGHCVLKREHTEKLSLMRTAAVGRFTINRDVYFDELFLKKDIDINKLATTCSSIWGRLVRSDDIARFYERSFKLLNIPRNISIYNRKITVKHYFEEFTEKNCLSTETFKRYEALTIHR